MKNTMQTESRLCPNCKKPLESDFPYCYACGSFLTPDQTELLPLEQVRDEDLAELLARSKQAQQDLKQRTRHKVANCFVAAGLIFFFLCPILILCFDLVWEGCISLVISLVLLPFPGLIEPKKPKSILTDKEIHKLIAKYIAPEEIRSVLGENISYEPENRLPESLFQGIQFPLRYYTMYDGQELVQGTFRNMPIEMGFAHLSRIFEYRFRKEDVHVFYGHFLHVKTELSIPAKIQITEKYFSAFGQLNAGSELNEFNRVFSVHCEDKMAVKSFLTPKIREKIAVVSRDCSGDLIILLNPDGQLLIASGEAQDRFTEDKKPEEWRAAYHKNLVQAVRILDCFVPENE